jgi:hypothetical protein
MMNLYQLNQNYLEIEQMLEESGGEITPEIEQLLIQNQDDFKNFAQFQIYLMRKFESQVEACKNEIKRISELAKSREKAVASLEANFLETLKRFGRLDKTGVYRYETDTLKISTRKSTVVEILDNKKIPSGFFNTPLPQVSKDEVKKALLAGMEIEGAVLKENINLVVK